MREREGARGANERVLATEGGWVDGHGQVVNDLHARQLRRSRSPLEENHPTYDTTHDTTHDNKTHDPTYDPTQNEIHDAWVIFMRHTHVTISCWWGELPAVRHNEWTS
ncbi:hypothetical protein Hamer_G011513 [Homarus americanus]|uniref:Uncharacterized protein n=1 Tax=Homarus americanus TaxID=6706 RepID=A0A8J5MYS6_HOMAM|nr:hypothetical protein Hamer_G011513 [Homarus americanus]